MNERGWVLPSLVLTLCSASFAIAMIPDRSGIAPAISILPYWMGAAAMIATVSGFFTMLLSGERRPLSRIARFAVLEWRSGFFIAACLLLAGVNMVAFMWTKPLLNYLVPFWADPLLADIDRALFLGHDPWALLNWLNSTPAALFYHRGWFAMMILTLLVVLKAPPSPEKSAVMLTYFLLWSVVGPIIHSLLPAAGPVFFAELGYGDRFAELKSVPETEQVAAYLWTIYTRGGFGAGSGISAMPSLHLATTAWMTVAFALFAPRWILPMVLAGGTIFLLSMSLGWHYAVDGLVGGAAAMLCYRLLRSLYARKPISEPAAAMPSPA